jgi:hypothetical protein
MTARGKHVNQVVVAIAREMAAFAWAIARLVPLASLQRVPLQRVVGRREASGWCENHFSRGVSTVTMPSTSAVK